MALSPRIEFRQSQLLVMTPQLMQAIKLLQLSNLDLVAYVEAELERNPLLERAEEDGSGDGREQERQEPEASEAPEHGDAPDWLATSLEGGAAIEAKLDTDLGNIYQDDHGRAADETAPAMPAESWSAAPSRATVSSDDYNLEAFVAGEKSLADHLADQFGLATADPVLRLLGQAIISEIDEAGYFRADLAEVGARLGATLAAAEAALAVVQSFDPAGVGARDLAECLAIQLRERDRYDPAMAALVGHLDLIARRDHAALMRLCGVDVSELPPEVYAAQLEVARARLAMPWANTSFLQAARSVVMTSGRRSHVHAMIRRIKAPGLLIHGARDRLVPLSIGKDVARLRPDWRFTVLDDVGHVPQLQVPERWLAAVTSWLDEMRA